MSEPANRGFGAYISTNQIYDELQKTRTELVQFKSEFKAYATIVSVIIVPIVTIVVTLITSSIMEGIIS